MRKTIDPLKRFVAGIEIAENGCWHWKKSITTNGYGEFVPNGNGSKTRAHIWSYLFFVGNYDRSLDLDHTCHNNTDCKGGKSCLHRRCVNPIHLNPVTRKENANNGNCGHYLSERTHCINGHEFNSDNTQFGKDNKRRCRKCRQLEHLKFKLKNPDRYKAAYTKANKKRVFNKRFKKAAA